MLPADRRSAPVGPEVSWPAGYSDRSTGTAITATRHRRRSSCRPRATAGTPTPPSRRPDTATTATGTRVTRARPRRTPASRAPGRSAGSSRPGQGWGQPGYPAPDGYAGSSYQQGNGYPQGRAYGQSGYAGSSYAPAGQIEMAYPPTAQSAEEYHGADSHRQPWDYDQPLRYDDGEVAYQGAGRLPGERRLPERQLPQRRVPDRGLRRRPPGAGLRLGRLQRLRLLDPRHRRHRLRPGRHHRHQRLRGGRLRRAELRPPRLRRPQVRRGPRLRGNARSPFDETRFDAPRLRRDPARQPVAAGR